MDSPSSYVFETERLGVAVSSADSVADVSFTMELRQQQSFIRGLGGSVDPEPFDKVKEWLKTRYEKMYLPYRCGHFVVWLKPLPPAAPARRIGQVVLVLEPFLKHPDVGFAFLDDAQGKGYASEAVEGLFEYGKREAALTAVTSITRANNEPSRRLLERCKFKLLAEVTVVDPRSVTREIVVYGRGEGILHNTDDYWRDIILQRMHGVATAAPVEAAGQMPA